MTDARTAPSSPAAARGTDIPALTGVRWFAAIVVVLFHIRGNYRELFPALTDALWPILDNGYLGVDLFFALSGFVLTLNYGSRLGDRLRRGSTASFLWARLARVWPAYVVTLVIAALWHGSLLTFGLTDPVPVDEFNTLSFLRQGFLVVLWTSPDYDRLTWNGPAWSVSAEALAYLAFPVVALLLIRLKRSTRVRSLVLLGVGCMLPVIIIAGATSVFGPYTWLLRLFGAFLAGSLMCLAVQRLRASGRDTERAGQAVTWICVVGALFTVYAAHWIDRPNASVLAIIFFPPLLAGLALSRGGLARVLGSRPLVFGGKISYSIYLTHMVLVIEPFWFTQGRLPDLLGPRDVLTGVYFVLVPVLACVTGWLLWRFVEEPARRHMLRMRGPASERTVTAVQAAAAVPSSNADRMHPEPIERAAVRGTNPPPTRERATRRADVNSDVAADAGADGSADVPVDADDRPREVRVS